VHNTHTHTHNIIIRSLKRRATTAAMENIIYRGGIAGGYLPLYTYVYARILLDSARAISCFSGGCGPPGTQCYDIAMAVGIRSRSVLVVVVSASPPGTPVRFETIFSPLPRSTTLILSLGGRKINSKTSQIKKKFSSRRRGIVYSHRRFTVDNIVTTIRFLYNIYMSQPIVCDSRR